MFHAAGARVAINGRNPETVARAIEEIGHDRLIAAPGDVRNVEDCSKIVETAVQGLGGLDCLVNNVGIGPLGRLMDVSEAQWDEVIAVNLRAAFFCTKAALTPLRASKGNVIIVSSVCGLIAGPPDGFVYSISKAGLIAMTKSLALELAPHNVRVNCLCPGYISTPMIVAENALNDGQLYRAINEFTPIGRIGSVRECVSAIGYFASEDARYCTGSILTNDGGCTANGSWGTLEQALEPPPPTTSVQGQ